MAYLKFLNSSEVYKCAVIPQDNIVTLKFDSDMEVSTAGFDLYLDEVCETDIGVGFYHDFTTVYRNDETTAEYNGYQLSKDGSVYVDPEPAPEPEPYEPTLEELKTQKINEINNICEQTIYAGVDVQLSEGTKHFSLKPEDQTNLLAKQVQLSAEMVQIEYHADGEPCKYYSADDMQKIITEALQYVSYHTTYCNSMHTWIENITNKDDLDNIVYGATIPVEYQSEVLQVYLMQM